MAAMISTSLTLTAEAGCEGDCMRCHPTLKDSPEHSSLSSCSACHNPETSRPKIFSQTNKDSGCGSRCFMCHSDWPKDAYHAPLNTCLNCHEK